MSTKDATTFIGDAFTGGAFSAREARKQAEEDTKKQRKITKKRLEDEKIAAATAEATAGEKSRKERERRARRGSQTTVRTSPVGLVSAAPGERKTLLGQ